jgi:hypothetical protein
MALALEKCKLITRQINNQMTDVQGHNQLRSGIMSMHTSLLPTLRNMSVIAIGLA